MRDLNPVNGLPFSQNARPFLYGGELDAVAAVLDSGQYGHGEVTEHFERAVADLLGVPDVVAVASGTAALHMALAVANIGPGDEVIVPSMTFCATVQAIRACGARARFAEVSPDTLCITGRDVMDTLTPSTRAVVPVLYGGRAADLSDIHETLADRGIAIVEDAAHAFGSRYGGGRVGAAGLLTCFSFGPIKNVTCGQGGALVPRTPEEAMRVRRMRLLGMAESPAERARSASYRVEGFGVRAHLSQINAAIGLAQLANFPVLEAKRKQLWRQYESALTSVSGVRLVDVDVDRSVPSLCAVRVPDRDRVFHALQACGIGAGVHYPPNHLQPAFARWHRPLPVTERIGEEILTLPFHQLMGADEVRTVVSALEGALR
ncbi:DegT/DnrJ/EryC1/StrS family aminotransferase [Streptomyces yaizuensis]|uniref:DegT/DnrJ/EryC1/StrS family aminotransferase n=1 Tax=Streptomyces yaizuensis TaxID=2989713 RepID=A0ABQ5NV84_9ACTN|nr:DegT/DnrJ/EryC1/StrS family aminotransferase [Streptomyces sp. YSPA8]GLF94271.1 DegT/DnrJ/EryC1/StrS family aminotransferase [Streptomyces sp. YSPA8]